MKIMKSESEENEIAGSVMWHNEKKWNKWKRKQSNVNKIRNNKIMK